MQAILTHDLQFSILPNSGKTNIVFIDESEYYENPKNPMLEVVFPRLSESFAYIINPRVSTTMNAVNLGYSNSKCDLPDGLYQFRFSVAPNHTKFICKNQFRTLGTRCKIKDILLKDKNISKETIAKLYEIDLYLYASEELANEDKESAVEFFNKANKLLDKLNCNG